jgi:uncharacterized protein YdcH (DUF465 family)
MSSGGSQRATMKLITVSIASNLKRNRRATSDEVLEKLKKQRLKLKDEITAILTKVERRM